MLAVLDEKFIAKAAKAVGDRNRLRILQEIARQGRITCAEAQRLTSLAQPSISHHIKLLTESGLVESEKTGRTVNLFLNKGKVDEFVSFFGGILKF
ncbi:MAG: helix-turn-helix transcriptional regulator [Ferruginibacter sp.]|nr:helix-turn-helix transcriptional regulator [Cytophagales bacterium]